jgi:hypothetical protein
MNLIRLILIGLIAYFIIRLLRWGKDKAPRVKKGREKSEPDPFKGAEIEDVPFTEIPPEEDDQESKPSG